MWENWFRGQVGQVWFVIEGLEWLFGMEEWLGQCRWVVVEMGRDMGQGC